MFLVTAGFESAVEDEIGGWMDVLYIVPYEC